MRRISKSMVAGACIRSNSNIVSTVQSSAESGRNANPSLVTGCSTPSYFIADEKALEQALRRILTADHYTTGKKAAAKQRISEIQQQVDKLTPTRDIIDAKVMRSSTSFLFANLSFLAAQFALLFNWVFFTFDWNLVEPVTYFLVYTVVWAGLVFYAQTGRSFSYDEIVAVLEERKKTKLCAKYQFDYSKYTELIDELDKAKEELRRY